VVCNPLSDFTVPLNLFVAGVGKTGTKKTPLKKTLVSGPLGAIHTAMREEFLAEWREWKAGGMDGPSPQEALLWVKDATGAALEQQLVIQEKAHLGLLLLRDELAGVFYGMDNPEQSGNEEQALLEIYDGDGIASLRVSTSNRVCTKTQLSIFGNIQPEVLEDLQQGPRPQRQMGAVPLRSTTRDAGKAPHVVGSGGDECLFRGQTWAREGVISGAEVAPAHLLDDCRGDGPLR
jgi:hypothetical protein